MTKALDEGHRSLLVPETTSVVFEENNGKLILIRFVFINFPIEIIQGSPASVFNDNLILYIWFLSGLQNNKHKSGELSIEDSLKEPTYDISIKAVKLKKLVQMYQVFLPI